MSDPLTPLRVADLALLALALPVFLIAGWPLLGWLTAAVVWLMWRGIGAYADKKALETDDIRKFVGIETSAMIGRGWLLGLLIIASGLTFGDRVGLSAALLAILLFTVSFTFKFVTRAFDAPPRGSKAPS
jgi:hypothetical protein